MTIKIALAGNPNTGKTTLFNALTGSSQHVGNWPGVTVEKKDGALIADRSVTVEDLPGIYSLSPYTMEEVVARKYLVDEKPDAILNIVDASCLERNLYLTTQLAELGIPTVIALNMIDIVESRGDTIDTDALSEELGCRVVPVSALRERGVDEAASASIEAAKGARPARRLEFSDSVESALRVISDIIKDRVEPQLLRWHSIKIFERDSEALDRVSMSDAERSRADEAIAECERALDDDAESIIISERYAVAERVRKKCLTKKDAGRLTPTEKVDRIVTHRLFALPIFAAIMFVVYYLSMNTIGTWGTDWINDELFGRMIPESLGGWMESSDVSPMLQGLVMDGMIAGVGAVLGFLPQMLVLFLCLAVLEDCGYMARIAFVLDRIFRKFGLSGKSFIPMLIATGCGVPGIMASRTVKSDSDRRLTVMTATFMPCSAKLPVIALLAAVMFGEDGWWVGPMAYLLGAASIIVAGVMLKKTRWFSGDMSPFVLELPVYHLPSIKGVLRTVYEQGSAFVKRAGSVILLASILTWFLQGYDWSLQPVETEDSMLASIGRTIEPVFSPLGWSEKVDPEAPSNGWRAAVASLSGLVAKENIVGTLAVLYGVEEADTEEEEVDPGLRSAMSSAIPSMAAMSFLIFNLLCAPCFAAIGAMRREMMHTGIWLGAVAFQCVYAYAIALIVYQIGSYAAGAPFGAGTLAAFGVILFGAYMLFIKRPYSHAKVQGGREIWATQ